MKMLFLITLFTFTAVSGANTDFSKTVPSKSNDAKTKVKIFVEQVLRAGSALNESEFGTLNEAHLVKTLKLLSVKKTGDVMTAKVSLQIDGLRVRDEITNKFSERNVRARWETVEFKLREVDGRFILLNLDNSKYQLRSTAKEKQ